MQKLTTVENRALALCEDLNASDGGTITVEWKRSAMYGHNPVIESNDGKCSNVSGGGYDKLSQCLADVLRYLFPVGSDAYLSVWHTGGAGERSTRDELAKHGWSLEKLTSTNSIDVYQLTRKS